MTRFVTKATPISYIDNKSHIEKLKSIWTCLIGYSDYISSEWFYSLGVGTHTNKQTNTHTNFPDKSYFKKPGICLVEKQLVLPYNEVKYV